MKIQFWFEFASTYSYPAAARIGAVGQAAGVEIEWEPFLLGPIFRDLGWKDSPFNLQPEKGRYMWRDLERLCEGYSLPFQRPSQFPRNSLLAARVACLGRGKSWLPDFARAIYHANFADDCDIADPQRVGDILASLDLPADEMLKQAEEDSTRGILKSQVERAREQGIFGAPSFTVGDELFWGNDRLGDAVAWARFDSDG
jgi:2-hydroxychromene-2-carboxylate isomerase